MKYRLVIEFGDNFYINRETLEWGVIFRVTVNPPTLAHRSVVRLIQNGARRRIPVLVSMAVSLISNKRTTKVILHLRVCCY